MQWVSDLGMKNVITGPTKTYNNRNEFFTAMAAAQEVILRPLEVPFFLAMQAGHQ